MHLQSEELWHQYYKETIHRIEDIVLLYDGQGVLVNWNQPAVQILGYEGHELTGLTIHSFFHPELPFLQTGNGPYYQEVLDVPVYRKNKTCFASNIRIMSVGDQQVYGICIIHNIQQIKDLKTQVMSLSNELHHANEVKNLFLANITHELRTPLNGMIGLLAMMDTTGCSQKMMEDCRVLKDCCKTMEKTVDQVLTYTKMAAGKLSATKEVFVVSELLAPIVRLHQSVASYRGLHFEVTLDSRVPVCLIGDQEWIGQVLNNLLSNAIKFTKQGSVRLEIVLQEETFDQVTVLFVVSDTGIGIKEEQQTHLFQSFSQGDASITRQFGGTGLGLAISKGMVEAMGGHLEVESKYGTGSRFYFELSFTRGNIQDVFKESEDELSNGESKEYGEHNKQQISFKYVKNDMENEENIQYLLSQISLSVELESWERAQGFCHQMRERLKNQRPDLEKLAFRLELASRRKDTGKAKSLYEELRRALTLVKEDSCEEGE